MYELLYLCPQRDAFGTHPQNGCFDKSEGCPEGISSEPEWPSRRDDLGRKEQFVPKGLLRKLNFILINYVLYLHT